MKTALVTHLGNYIGDTDAIEETTCDDNDARRHLLLSTVTIGFTVAVAVEDSGYDSADTDGLASDLATTLTTVVSSGAIASTIAANAGETSSFQSAALHADLSTAAIASATTVTAVETVTHVSPTPSPTALASIAPNSSSATIDVAVGEPTTSATSGEQETFVAPASPSASSAEASSAWLLLAALGVVGAIVAVAACAALKHRASNGKYAIAYSSRAVLPGLLTKDDAESPREVRAVPRGDSNKNAHATVRPASLRTTLPAPSVIGNGPAGIATLAVPAAARGLPVSLVATATDALVPAGATPTDRDTARSLGGFGAAMSSGPIAFDPFFDPNSPRIPVPFVPSAVGSSSRTSLPGAAPFGVAAAASTTAAGSSPLSSSASSMAAPSVWMPHAHSLALPPIVLAPPVVVANTDAAVAARRGAHGSAPAFDEFASMSTTLRKTPGAARHQLLSAPAGQPTTPLASVSLAPLAPLPRPSNGIGRARPGRAPSPSLPEI